MPSVVGVSLLSGEYRVAYNGMSNTLSTLVPVANRMYLVPFVTTYAITIASLGINNTTTSSNATFRLGFYASGSDGRPTGAALVDSGSISGMTVNGFKSAAVSFTLDAGTQYWAALVPQVASTTIRAISQANMTAISHATNSTVPRSHLYINNVTGSLPTISGTLTWGSGTTPAVYMGA